MFRVFFIALFLLAFKSLYAQFPNRFTIGKEELEGAHVYNIFQSSDGIYWIATSQGLYKFDGYEFSKMVSDGMAVQSYFSIKENHSGEIFCHNLSGQIAVVKEDTVALYFEIPDTLKSSYLFYDFDKENNLVVGSKALFKVKNNEVTDICTDLDYPSIFSENVRLSDGDLVVICNHKKKVTIKSSEYVIEEIDRKKYPHESVIPIMFEGELLLIGKNNGQIIDGNSNPNWVPGEEGSNYLYNDSEVYSIGLVTGLSIVGDDKK